MAFVRRDHAAGVDAVWAWAATATVLLGFVPVARAGDEPQAGRRALPAAAGARQEPRESEAAIDLAKQEVARYELFHDAEQGETRLQLRPKPVMRWSNALERRFYGDVFLWTHEGCPAVIASITNVYGRYHAMETEVHSLAASKIRATRDGGPFWHPQQAGVTRQAIPEAPGVADSAETRLQQMRNLARRFSATASGRDQRQLRLLPQPIFRYESSDPAVVDGAVFAFAVGTDPEVLLLIEAFDRDAPAEWHFAAARFNGHVNLAVSLDGREVWSVPPLSGNELKDPRRPYFTFRQRSPATEAGK